jgi:hypothetical protein
MANLNQLLERLLLARLEFVLVGGFAGVLHGSSQITRDIDICMDLNPKVIELLRKTLAGLHPVHRHPKRLSFLDHPSDLTQVKNVYLYTDLGPLDILSEIKGVGGYTEVVKEAVSIPLFGHVCRVMGIDTLITSKRALEREKDRAMILELEVIRKRQTK